MFKARLLSGCLSGRYDDIAAPDSRKVRCYTVQAGSEPSNAELQRGKVFIFKRFSRFQCFPEIFGNGAGLHII